MRHLVSLAVLLLATPALADDAPAAKPSGSAPAAGSSGQTSDSSAAEDPAHVKGYGYGTPSGTESNASAGQAAPKGNRAKKRKAPQQEADHDSAQPNPKAAEQGQNVGPMAGKQKAHAKKRVKKPAKPAEPAAGEPTR